MFDFCPQCGQTLEQEQVAGRMLVCAHCGKDIGFVGSAQRVVIDETEQRIKSGAAARCTACQQVVDVKPGSRTLVPHYRSTAEKKICPGSGKPIAVSPPTPEPKKPPTGKDLSAYMNRDVIKVILVKKNAEPTIEVLTLDYLDKKERVRIQIEAMREMLGPSFRMREFPPNLKRPDLAMWAAADACVIAAKHPQGGMQSIADADVLAIIAEVRQQPALFLA